MKSPKRASTSTKSSLMDYRILSDGIIYIEGAISAPSVLTEIFETIDGVAAGEWKPWLAGDVTDRYEYGTLKEISRTLVDKEESSKRLFVKAATDAYDRAIFDSFELYYDHIGLSRSSALEVIEGYKQNRPPFFSIKKYFVGEGLGPHPDAEPEAEDSKFRCYTISMYINDDYEGGQLGFPDVGVYLKPAAGSVVIFPATTLHESTPVVSGTKYVTSEVCQIERKILEKEQK